MYLRLGLAAAAAGSTGALGGGTVLHVPLTLTCAKFRVYISVKRILRVLMVSLLHLRASAALRAYFILLS